MITSNRRTAACDKYDYNSRFMRDQGIGLANFLNLLVVVVLPNRRAARSGFADDHLQAMKPARWGCHRAGSGGGLVAVLPAAAGPGKCEALAILIAEEIGVDGSREARVVQRDREVIATLAGALGPGRADLHTVAVDPVAGRLVVAPAGFGDDANALGLYRQGRDLALELVGGGFLERTNVSHVIYPLCCYRGCDHRCLDGDH